MQCLFPFPVHIFHIQVYAQYIYYSSLTLKLPWNLLQIWVLQGKINDKDKQKILHKCNETINWLNKNQTAEKEEFEHHRKSWRKSATPLLRSYTRVQEACQEECLEAFLVVELLLLVVPPLGLPLKRLIKPTGCHCSIHLKDPNL